MNSFKQNSRFSLLVENNEVTKDKTDKSKKTKEKTKENAVIKTADKLNDNELNKDNSFKKNSNRYSNDWMVRDEIKKEEERKIAEIIKEKEIKQALSMESFPEMVPSIIRVNNIPLEGVSFSEKLQTNNIILDNDLEYTNLLPGWTMITPVGATKNKFNLRTKSTHILGAEMINNSPELEILDGLVELYENRNNEYIENWGYEEWEEMFQFPNYDYTYFDKLDEIYYEEMEHEEIDREENDEEEYYDMISEYDN